jgi:membrane-associated protease RseP (regulator of RpoE activity)
MVLCPRLGADTPNSQPAAVAFDLLPTKHIVVKIKVNGQGPYRVIFDTGAPVMLLNYKIAKASGILPKDAKPPWFPLFGAPGENKIKILEIGELTAKNVSTIVMDHPTVELISKHLGPIDGIVGFPFFARYQTTIDYQAKKLTFVPNGFNPPDTLKALMASVMALADDKPRPPKVLTSAGQWGILLHKDKNDEEAGTTIREVLPGSPAAAAGLKPGDRMLSLDGRWTDTLADVYLAASKIKSGSSAKVVVRRENEEIELTVKPQEGL